jgi:hypothetical protein
MGGQNVNWRIKLEWARGTGYEAAGFVVKVKVGILLLECSSFAFTEKEKCFFSFLNKCRAM